MNVLLINPPSILDYPVLPLGIAAIAAFLEEKGIKVSVIDAWAEGIDYNEVGDRISKIKPDVIGISIMSPRFKQAKMTAKVSRKAAPNATIVLGGPHPSALPKETLEEIKEADICVIGEGEQAMYYLLDALNKDGKLYDVKGIAFRDENSGIIVTEPQPRIENLDSLPIPAGHLFPLEKYRTHPPYGKKKPYMTMITSRGCPFKCAYCSKEVFGRKLKAQSPKRVVDEMEFLINKYGIKEIHFYDDDFTIDMKRAEKICDEIIKRNIKILWSCTTRVDLVNQKLLRKMKESGCWAIAYGVESGNQEILDAMEKGIMIEQIRDAFRMTREAGIKILAWFMVGLPGESTETIQKSKVFCKEIKPDFVRWSVLTVYPGSPFYKMVKQGKFGGEERLKYISNSQIAFEDNFTVEQLHKEAKKAQIEFYFRPGYILNRLINIRSFGEFIHYFRGGVAVVLGKHIA